MTAFTDQQAAELFTLMAQHIEQWSVTQAESALTSERLSGESLRFILAAVGEAMAQEPVAYSVTYDGEVTNNIFLQRDLAQHHKDRLDRTYDGVRTVLPLYAAVPGTPDTDVEREKDLRAMLEKVAREVQAECDKARRVDKWWGFDYKIIDAAITATKE